MPSKEQQSLLREIWNHRFNIHSLRPLQSKVTHVTEEYPDVMKFHIEHRILPSPLPFKAKDEIKAVRRRELKFKAQSIQDTLSARQIRTLSVNKNLPIELAVIERLKQHGIIIGEVEITKIHETKPIYTLKVLRSGYVKQNTVVKLTILQTAEDLLSTEFLDGNFNSKNGEMILYPTSYVKTTDKTISAFYGSLIAWERNNKFLKVTAKEDYLFCFYDVSVGDLNDYNNHLKLRTNQPVIIVSINAGEHFTLQFSEDKTILSTDQGNTDYPLLTERMAMFISNQKTKTVASPFRIEITSMEQV